MADDKGQKFNNFSDSQILRFSDLKKSVVCCLLSVDFCYLCKTSHYESCFKYIIKFQCL